MYFPIIIKNICSMTNILGKYKIVKSLGSGGFATVFLVTDNENNQMALKMMEKKKLSGMQDYVENQIKIMKQMDSEHILKLYECRQDQKYIYLLMQYCNGRDLQKLQCNKQNKVFSLKEATYIISEVLKGLEVIHSKGYLHRDIKPQNVLVTNQNGQHKFKIADFGFSKPQQVSQTVVGTPVYMSPEIFKNAHYGFQVDMWALGVMLYIMLNKVQPFQINVSDSGQKNEQCYQELVKQASNFSYRKSVEKTSYKFKQNCLPQTQDLFMRIFEINPAKRMNFVEIRSHPLFKEYFPTKMDEKSAKMIMKNEIKEKTEMRKKMLEIEEDQENENISPKIGASIQINPHSQFAQEKQYLHHKNQSIQFLYDNYYELDHSHGLLTHIQKMMLCYNLLKYYIILKRNFLASIQNQSIMKEQTATNCNFGQYFKTNQSKAQIKQYEEQLQHAMDQFTLLHGVCQKNLQIIKKNNPNFTDAFNQEINEKQLAGPFKPSYRGSTNAVFNKLRKFLGTDNSKGNSCSYYLALVVISHVFNRIFVDKQKIYKIFKDFSQNENNSENLDYGKLRQWMSKATPLQLNAVTKNIMKCFL